MSQVDFHRSNWKQVGKFAKQNKQLILRVWFSASASSSLLFGCLLDTLLGRRILGFLCFGFGFCSCGLGCSCWLFHCRAGRFCWRTFSIVFYFLIFFAVFFFFVFFFVVVCFVCVFFCRFFLLATGSHFCLRLRLRLCLCLTLRVCFCSRLWLPRLFGFRNVIYLKLVGCYVFLGSLRVL